MLLNIKVSTYIGISGWTYPGWRGTFYPPKLPHYEELKFASHQLPSIEINGTFYSLQRPSSYRRWFEQTPENFLFSLKANRYITHIKKLNDIKVPMANFFASGIFNLAHKLGPILWQFPPSMPFDPDKFERFLNLLPKTTEEARKLARTNELTKSRVSLDIIHPQKIRHAIEIRNFSFLNPWFIELLRKYDVALVFADTAGRWPYMEDLTSDFIYLRLHGDSELYVSGYDDTTLNFWAERIINWIKGERPEKSLNLSDETGPTKIRDAFIYFDNDAKVRAPIDAKNLIEKVNIMASNLLH